MIFKLVDFRGKNAILSRIINTNYFFRLRVLVEADGRSIAEKSLEKCIHPPK